MDARVVILVILVGLVGLGHAALDEYPRPWENSTWMEENPYFVEFFGIKGVHTGEIYLDEQEDLYELMFQEKLPSLHDSLLQLSLEKLDADLQHEGISDPNLQSALEKKNEAEELKDPDSIEALLGLTLWQANEYVDAWMACADYSLLALESYAREVNDERDRFDQIQETIIDAGICDKDYVGPSKEACDAELGEDVECNYTAIWEDIPSFDWYYPCVEAHWEKTIEFREAADELNDSYIEAVDYCYEARELAEEKKADADVVFANIEAEELDSIYESGSGHLNSGALGIQEHYTQIEEIKKIGDTAFRDGEPDEGDSGWLKACAIGNGVAITSYDAIITSEILDEAEWVVDARGEEARGILDSVEEKEAQLSTSGLNKLEKAQGACREGDSGKTLGLRYEEYGDCAKYASAALSDVASGAGIEEAEVDASLSELQDFLIRADADGIETTSAWIQYEVMLNKGVGSLMEIENIRQSVLDKAEAKYGHLPEKRKELKELIAQGGSEFAYLNSWFDGESCYSGDRLNYECGLGELKVIGDSYTEIEKQLYERKESFVESSLVVSDWMSWEIPVLDQKTETYLYVEITNPTNFDAGDIMIEVPTDLELRKIDLVSGSEHVRMISLGKSDIEIYLSGINASKTIQLVFKKDEIVCRSEDYDVAAYGDGEGGATVTQTLDVECKYEVGGLILGEEWGATSVSVDGMDIALEGEGITKELSKGKHEIVIESYDFDAYEVEREPSFVSTIGQTTKVELFFNFEPNRDLDYIAYSSVEDGKIVNNKVDVFGYTGEKITDKKVMGESTLFFKVYDLVEGKETKVRVSFEISDLEEYISQEILYYSAQNLTQTEQALLDEAKNQLLANEDVEAYNSIEELRSAVEKRAKTHNSMLAKHEKLAEKIESKIEDLDSAIELARALGIGNSYVSEMSARGNELENALAQEVDEDALLSPLESVDLGWEKKELTKISKELLKEEKDLKERWGETDLSNPNMSLAMEEIEGANSKFAGSLNFDDAMLAFSSLEAGEDALEGLEASYAALELENRGLLEQKIEAAEDVFETYNKEYEEADGTHLEGLFQLKPSAITKDLKDLGKEGDYAKAILEVDILTNKMEKTLDLLAEEEKLLEENVESLYYQLKDKMNDQDSKFIEAAITNAKNYAAKGNYIMAISSLEDALNKMQNLEEGDEGILILAITGLLVLGLIGLYLLRDQIPKDILPLKQKEEKAYRRLKRER